MQAFQSADLSNRIAEIMDAAEAEPMVLLAQGQPKFVVMSAEEFRRLKAAASESVPAAARPVRPLVLRGRVEDPLGYDVTDIRAAAHRMADDALTGRTAAAVEAEQARIRVRLGLSEQRRKGSG